MFVAEVAGYSSELATAVHHDERRREANAADGAKIRRASTVDVDAAQREGFAFVGLRIRVADVTVPRGAIRAAFLLEHHQLVATRGNRSRFRAGHELDGEKSNQAYDCSNLRMRHSSDVVGGGTQHGLAAAHWKIRWAASQIEIGGNAVLGLRRQQLLPGRRIARRQPVGEACCTRWNGPLLRDRNVERAREIDVR